MKEKNALVGHNFRFNSSLREGVTPHFLMSAIVVQEWWLKLSSVRPSPELAARPSVDDLREKKQNIRIELTKPGTRCIGCQKRRATARPFVGSGRVKKNLYNDFLSFYQVCLKPGLAAAAYMNSSSFLEPVESSSSLQDATCWPLLPLKP